MLPTIMLEARKTEKQKTTKQPEIMDTISIEPSLYYKTVYGQNGSYTQEDRFDKSIGLKWIGGYKFAIINLDKWNQAKEKFKF